MPQTLDDRLAVPQWSSPADAFPDQAEWSTFFDAINDNVALDAQGAGAGRPAAAVRGRWYFATDTRRHLYRDDGAAWHEIPLTAQRNDYTAEQTVALAAESVTEATDTLAPLGVTRLAGGSAGSYFAMAKSAGGQTWAAGIGPTTPDGSGEVSPLVFGVPSATKTIPTPLLYLSTGGAVRAPGTLSYFGPWANGQASSTRIAAGQVDAANAEVAAQGAGANVALMLRGQGAAGSIVAQPTPGATVLTVAPSLITAAQRVSVTAGGLDVAGSPSGYTAGELRFPTAAGDVGISTAQTGAGVFNLDHRGAGNTGSWAWRNGTGAATQQMALTGGGVLRLTGTTPLVALSSSSSAGQLAALPAATFGIGYDAAQLNVYDAAGAKGLRLFDTVNSVARFSVGAAGAGIAALGVDHYLGDYANGAGAGVSRLHVGASSTFVALSAEGDGANRDLYVKTKGTGSFYWQTSTPTTVARLDSGGGFAAQGADHYLGNWALGNGVSVARLHVATPSFSEVDLLAEGDTGTVHLFLKPKGNGGTVQLITDTNQFIATLNPSFTHFYSTVVNFQNSATATTGTVGGAASTLPANPVGYLIIQIAGNYRRVPFYS